MLLKFSEALKMLKKLFVHELRMRRIAAGLTSEELTKIHALGPEWPSVGELESNPSLFSSAYNQRLVIASLDRFDDDARKVVQLTGSELSPFIDKYLADPAHMEVVVKDFKDTVVSCRVTYMPEGPDEYVRKVLSGEPVREFHPNMLPPKFYASLHLYSMISQELAELEKVSV